MTITTTDPATGEALQTYPAHDAPEVDAAVGAAYTAWQTWRNSCMAERATLLRTVGRLLTERRERYAALATAEMGKPISESLAEIDKCARSCEVVADLAPGWLADDTVETSASKSWLRYEPLGVVLAIMPWNYPFWQVIRFVCAAVMAGDTAVLKHAPNVTGCALAIDELVRDAADEHGAPENLLRVIIVADADVPQVVPDVIRDDRIAAVTLTGSERAGAAVASAAGAALKKVVLELGGSDPFVVLADADLDEAARVAVQSRFGNGGQSCIAAKRIIVVDAVADRFVELLTERMAALTLGDPGDSGTSVGPLARADLRDELHAQVQRTVDQGAVLVTGGEPVDGPGFWYAPTLLDGVDPSMVAASEETFGPVGAIIRVEDEDAAVEAANATSFGLGAAVWGSPDRALAVGQRINSGALFVNALVASDARIPFGGIGRSGYGRELGAQGVREFTNPRTYWIG